MEINKESLKVIEEMRRWTPETRWKMVKIISEEDFLRCPESTETKIKHWQKAAKAFCEANRTVVLTTTSLEKFLTEKVGSPVKCVETVVKKSLE